MKKSFTLADTNFNEIGTGAIGHLAVIRVKKPGIYEVGLFIVDCGCMGVKQAIFDVLNDEELEDYKSEIFGADGYVEQEAAWGRKFVEGAVAYAKQFGIKPHRNYKKAARVFGGIHVKDCETVFEYGKGGQPYFVPGPHEDTSTIQRILRQLEHVCGDAFEFINLSDDVEENEDPLTDEVDNLLAEFEKRLNKRSVIKKLRKLATEYPDSAVAQYGYGTALVVKGDLEQGCEALEKSLKLDPKFAYAWYNLANAYSKMGKMVPMIQAYQQVLLLGNPDEDYHQAASNNLKDIEAMILKDEGIDLETYIEAGQHFDRAWQHMDELAWEAGLAEMREAARLNPRSYQSFGNIGVCLLKLNRNEEAREALEQALEINPKYAIAINNLRILTKKEI